MGWGGGGGVVQDPFFTNIYRLVLLSEPQFSQKKKKEKII